MTRAGPDAGFLLAETLITLALSALVLVGLTASTAVLLRATDRSVARVGAADDIGRTLFALTRDLASLKRARWSGLEPQGFVFRGGPNSLFFAQELPAAAGGRELRAVSLREIATGRGTALVRADAALPPTAAGWGDLRFDASRPLPTGAARLRFRYLAERGVDEPAPRPIDAWPSGSSLPEAVLVDVVDAVTTRLVFTDRIALRADGDIGCADKRPPKRDEAARAGQAAAAPALRSAEPLGGMQSAASPPPVVGASDEQTIGVAQEVANRNEFCGRADKGVAKRDRAAGPAGGPGVAGATAAAGAAR